MDFKKDFEGFAKCFKEAKGKAAAEVAKGVFATITGKAICGLVALCLVVGVVSCGGGGSSGKDFTYELTEDGTGVRLIEYIGKGSSVSIPKKVEGMPVTEVGRGCFYNGKISKATLRKGVKYGEVVFGGCEKLKSVTIEEGVEEITYKMFTASGSLESITIPASVKKIGAGAFMFCDELKNVEFKGTPTLVVSKSEPNPFDCCENLTIKSQNAIKALPTVEKD